MVTALDNVSRPLGPFGSRVIAVVVNARSYMKKVGPDPSTGSISKVTRYPQYNRPGHERRERPPGEAQSRNKRSLLHACIVTSVTRVLVRSDETAIFDFWRPATENFYVISDTSPPTL